MSSEKPGGAAGRRLLLLLAVISGRVAHEPASAQTSNHTDPLWRQLWANKLAETELNALQNASTYAPSWSKSDMAVPDAPYIDPGPASMRDAAGAGKGLRSPPVQIDRARLSSHEICFPSVPAGWLPRAIAARIASVLTCVDHSLKCSISWRGSSGPRRSPITHCATGNFVMQHY
jgi:hypothetical protein